MPAQEGGRDRRRERGKTVAISESPQSKSEAHDLIVIGAGVIGLAVAWRAARRGLRTVVLESGEAGGGATRVAAGMLAPVTEADFGEERLLEANLASARFYPRFIAELEEAAGRFTGYRPTGAIHVAVED